MKRSLILIAFVLGLLSCREEQQSETDPLAKDTLSHASEIPVGTLPHGNHHAPYADMGTLSETQWDSVQGHGEGKRYPVSHDIQEYKIFGWHPFFMGSTYEYYNYSLLWGIAYFSYEVDPATGSYKSIHNWKTTAMVDSAQKHGTKVFLAVNNFGGSNNHRLLSNAKARQTLIDSLCALVKLREADGINLDFEEVEGQDRDSLSTFVRQLSQRMQRENPDWMLSLALYTVDWHKVFQIPELLPYVDLFTLMGYDYYYCGSSKAGPVTPLNSGKLWADYNLERSVDYYLKAGVPKNKLIAALPYYGRQWSTQSENVPGQTIKCLGSPTYRQVRGLIEAATTEFDSVSSTLYVKRKAHTDEQIWFDGVKSLGLKYDWIKSKGLAGTGMWALGYDHGYTDLWELLGEKFGKKQED